MIRQLNPSVFSRAILYGLALVLFLSAAAHAAWYKDYESAMDLLKKGQNSQAIPKLESAIAEKNEEGTNIKFYGMKFGDYFPHYYLGMAYFSQKNYEAALREFETSERFGAIRRERDLYEKMNSLKTLAKAQISVKKEPQIADATPPVVIVPVQPPAQETKIEVKKEEKPEEKKVTELPVQRTPTSTTPEIKKKEPPPPPVLPVDAGLEAAKLMVKNGARKYFEGDYDSAISYLSNAIEVNPRELSAQFLLGCAYASKYLLSGSENQDLLKNASGAFQKLKKANPDYQPRNKIYFSPAVLDLYART